MEKRSLKYDFFNHDSEELYYFLGFIAADGYIGNNSISIELNDIDAYMIKKFKDLIDPKRNIYHRDSTHSSRVMFQDKQYAQYLHQYFGMTTNKKSKELKFPENIPDQYLKDFIRGYIDGDGCIDTTKGYRDDKVYIGPRLRILSTYDFLEVLNKHTKKAYAHKTNAINKKGKNNVYCITYNFATAKMLLKWLYKGCHICLQRKYDKAKEVTENFSTTIKRYSLNEKCIKIHTL